MVDVHTPAQRSRNMRAVRAKNTAPELIIRRALHAAGYRYRLHVKHLPGSPDIALPKHRVAIFVDGCFWHGHGCALFKIPQTRTEFWIGKIEGNRRRDLTKDEQLLAQGWRVFHVWECALRGVEAIELPEILSIFKSWLMSNDRMGSIPQAGTAAIGLK